eukprot:16330330-Heterocapsa_arctica.AAC.1
MEIFELLALGSEPGPAGNVAGSSENGFPGPELHNYVLKRARSHHTLHTTVKATRPKTCCLRGCVYKWNHTGGSGICARSST